MAIQKELNIKFPLDEVVQIKDTKNLPLLYTGS